MNGKIKKILIHFSVLGLFFTQLAYSDTFLSYSDESEQIYFGFVDTGFPGVLQLVVCCVIGEGEPDISRYPLGTGRLYIHGNGGNDHIEAIDQETKFDIEFGDITRLTYSRIYIYGDEGDDEIIGTPMADTIFGGNGDDNIKGLDGNDSLYGQGDNDVIDGGAGDDYIHSGTGKDNVYGDRGDDDIRGGDDDDFLRGGSGNDSLFGMDGNDYLIGDQDDDQIYGGEGDDIIIGGTGVDMMDGGPGRDTCWGRRAKEPTVYDPMDARNHHNMDWNDIDDAVNIEEKVIRDPYQEWAFITENRNHVTFDQLTTSNPNLLFQDSAAGASLLSSVGDMPLALDSNADRRVDDVAVYRPSTNQWYYDAYHNGTTDDHHNQWGMRGDRPISGDFDGDNRCDDVAVFRPSTQTWFFDFNHDGTTNLEIGPWGIAGDLPISGDFDRDGVRDDIAVFRPAIGMWFFDYNHDGSTDEKIGPWGNIGDIPVAGDFDRDGFVDDIAVFRSLNCKWYFDFNHDCTTDVERGPWGILGDMPIAGDFDRDTYCDDIAMFRPSTGKWYYNHNYGTITNSVSGPWGSGGEMLHTTHKQYPASCGFSALNIVMEHLGRTQPGVRRFYPRDLDQPANPIVSALWNPSTMVDVGYPLSTEHIIYENFHYLREEDPDFVIKEGIFMNADGRLNTNDSTASSSGSIRDASYYEIQYNIGHVEWFPTTQLSQGNVQMWAEVTDGVGASNLTFIANKYSGTVCDANYISSEVGHGQRFVSFDHLKDVIKAFVDRNVPLLVSIENGGHYNTLMGYWEVGADFYIYLADPLDGWGRPFYLKPMRWRKMKVNEDALPSGSQAFCGLMIYGYSGGNPSGPTWAKEIDSRYGSDMLCGHLRLND